MGGGHSGQGDGMKTTQDYHDEDCASEESWERSEVGRGKGILRLVKSHHQRPRKYYLSHKHSKKTLLTTHDAINTKTEIWIENKSPHPCLSFHCLEKTTVLILIWIKKGLIPKKATEKN